MKNTSGLNRRTFLKGVGVVAAMPLLAKTASAEELVELSARDSHLHKILCCNIRVALPEDEKTGNGWKARKDICADIIRKQNADIICLQEVMREQNEDMKKALPGFFSFGFEGPEMDEFMDNDYHFIAKNPIFFSTKRYELLSAGGFWLSETPLVAGSKSWDTARARHTNWVRLRDKKSGQQIRVVNLHLDHVSQPARENQTKMVLQEAAQYQPNLHQIFTGDFNAGGTNKVHELIRTAGWADTYAAIHGADEPGFTVHEFQGDDYVKKAKGKKIDFIYTKGTAEAKSATIIKDNVNGHYPSDHYFVSAEVELR
jgi:endonuclease/exonuclease/phosphatase family metal-dependent hydrolase